MNRKWRRKKHLLSEEDPYAKDVTDQIVLSHDRLHHPTSLPLVLKPFLCLSSSPDAPSSEPVTKIETLSSSALGPFRFFSTAISKSLISILKLHFTTLQYVKKRFPFESWVDYITVPSLRPRKRDYFLPLTLLSSPALADGRQSRVRFLGSNGSRAERLSGAQELGWRS